MDTLFVSAPVQHWSGLIHAPLEHNYSLIVLSGMIAIFVALTATYILERLSSATTPLQQWLWLVCGAVAMGCGIWAVHFIAMLAVSQLALVHAAGRSVGSSVLVIVVVSLGASYLIAQARLQRWRLLAAGALLGIGLICLHLLNLEAFASQISVRYSPVMGTLALFAVVALSTVAALCLGRACHAGVDQHPAKRLLCAAASGLVLVLAPLCLWTMALLTPVEPGLSDRVHLHSDQIVPILAVGTMLINGAALLAAMMERRLHTTTDNAAQRLQLILDSVPVGVAYVDTDLRFHFTNRPFLQIYFSEDTDLIGRSLSDVAPKDAQKRVLPHYHRALLGHRRDFVATTDLGENRTAYRHVSLVPDRAPDGVVCGIFIVVHDVSEQVRSESKLRESEQRLMALLKHVPAAVFLKDQNARYQLVNRQYEEWFGLDNERAAGRTVHELFPPERAQRYWQGDKEILATGRVTTDELRIPLTNGEWRTFILTKFPIVDGGQPNGYGGIMVDVNERAESEKALRQSERRAELANRAKSEFLANMSHELRTPLNAILGFTEILREQMLGPLGTDKYIEYAADIHDSADHLLGLINDILDLSKIESGADELLEEDLRIGDVVDSVLTLVKGRAADGQVEIVSDIEPGLPMICADKRKLKQVLVNLLTNAVKFTPAGGRVIVRARWQPAEALVLQVVDSGIGMAPEDIPMAMAPFGQIDSSFSRRFEGTGLGLPLANQLVIMHGGELDIQSREGQGTTVTVRLPPERALAEIVPRSARAS